ncbi:MAG: adenylate/guanylate cyclase domain-containing protein [Hyphomicrobiales bacterium]|nr:adenylate/guanylate cyclase domain-containing protein [Hyphomicrobiales bacterium]MCP5372812.1 adenylate/guanylate cyclase domain-containing protein [Hyphomicrobiales bacterium]
MAEGGITRKLTAILYADVAGYSRLTGEDELGTHRTLSVCLDLISGTVERHGGRVVHYAGDAVLADFGSVVAALTCAVEVQAGIAARNAADDGDRDIQFRIGINLGEVIVDRGDIYGDGVNVAARLESLAEPGGICISASVHDQVRDKVDVGFQFMGRQKVKNIAEPVAHYRVVADGSATGGAGRRARPAWMRPVVRAAAVVLLLILGAGLWQALAPGGGSPPARPSLAVLPFRTIGGGESQRVFSEGLSEDLATALAAVPTIRVISGGEDGGDASPEDQGRRLKAQYVFEGTVRGEGRIRITAQLIEVRSGYHLWGGRYDRDLGDNLALQSELSARLVVTLAEKLDQVHQENLDATGGPGAVAFARGMLEPLGRIAGEAVALPAAFVDWLMGGDGK